MDKNVVPEISVLLPVYNSEKYILEAVNSILNQTFTNFELIIIDDGSRDSSIQIINSIKDERIVFLRNEENKGLIYTLNKGIGLSKGNYIARMDADDISENNRFMKQLTEFKKDSNLVICGSYIKTFGNGAEEFINHIPSSNSQILSSIFFRCPFAHPSVMIKKSALMQLDEFYREDYKHSEDYDLWSRLVFKGNSLNIPEYLLNYRVHENQVSTVFEEHKYQSVLKIQKNVLVKFGIFPNEIESIFLINFFKGISRNDTSYLEIGILFLNNIQKQFKEKYPQYIEIHSQILVSRWMKICGNSGLGYTNIKLAFKLSFFKLKYLKFKDLLKLLYKTLTKYTQLEKIN